LPLALPEALVPAEEGDEVDDGDVEDGVEVDDVLEPVDEVLAEPESDRVKLRPSVPAMTHPVIVVVSPVP
jgi:hypothetical protein